VWVGLVLVGADFYRKFGSVHRIVHLDILQAGRMDSGEEMNWLLRTVGLLLCVAGYELQRIAYDHGFKPRAGKFPDWVGGRWAASWRAYVRAAGLVKEKE